MTRNSTTDWGWPAKILHWVGAARVADPAAVVAMAESVARASRYAEVGADCCARIARRVVRADGPGLAHGMDGGDDIPRPHDQRFARNRRTADRHGCRPVGAAVDRGITYGAGLSARPRRADPRRCRAASPYA